MFLAVHQKPFWKSSEISKLPSPPTYFFTKVKKFNPTSTWKKQQSLAFEIKFSWSCTLHPSVSLGNFVMLEPNVYWIKCNLDTERTYFKKILVLFERCTVSEEVIADWRVLPRRYDEPQKIEIFAKNFEASSLISCLFLVHCSIRPWFCGFILSVWW